MRLIAFSEVLPGEPVTNRDLAERFGLHEGWLDMMTGNRSRYLCSPDSAPGVPKVTSDLAVAAATRALAKADIDPATLDFIVLTTASPDQLMPATVNLVADRIGVNDIPTFQLTSGCAGALQGLYTAKALLSDGMKRGLVIGADSCGKLFPSESGLAQLKPAELINFALFGDGAGAAIVDADDDGGPGLVLEHMLLRTTGQGRKPAQVVRWYGAQGAPEITLADGTVTREAWGEEDYKAIEHHVPEMAEMILKELGAATGWQLEQVEHVLIPQLNGVMTDKIRDRLGVRTDQAVNCVADTGNNGNALPFVQLHRAMERIEAGVGQGGRVFVATVESSKWIVSGMALRHQQEARGHVG